MTEIKVKIKGTSPLLMAKFTDRNLKKTSKVGRKTSKTKKEQAEVFAYRDEKTQELYIPALCIFSSIMAAGRFHKSGKCKVTTLKSSLLCGAVKILEDKCSLGTKDFEVDARATVNPSTGGRNMTYRPKLENWSVKFTLKIIDETSFDSAFLMELTKDAGIKCGLLSYRPQRKGWFGQFEIVEWND